MDLWNLRRPRLAPVGAALALMTLSCSGAESGDGEAGSASAESAARFRTLEWSSVGGAAEVSDPRVVASLLPGDLIPGGARRWSAAAPGGVKDVKLPQVAGVEPEVPAIALMGLGKGKRLSVSLAGIDDRFNEVLVELQTFTRKLESVDVSLVSGGRTVSRAHTIQLEQISGRQSIAVPMSGAMGLSVPADSLRLDFAATRQSTMAVTRITLLERDPMSFVPAVEAPATRLAGDHFRECVGLKAGAAIEVPVTAVDLQGGSTRLTFALGQVAGMAKVGQRLLASVEILERGSGKLLESLDYELGSSGGPGEEIGWQDVTIDLPAESDGLVVRLSCPAAGTSNSGSDLLLVALPALVRGPQPGAAPPPTIVLISSDTHRADHIGLMGGAGDSTVFTPTLDALGNGGVIFQNCYSTTNVTTPSHVALLTGQHPRDVRIVTNRVRLSDQASTLAERFQEEGFMTLAVTSVAHLLDPSSGLGQGFHRMEGPSFSARDADVSIARARAWLKEAEGRPVFLWLHLFDAHDPYGPPEPYAGKYYPEGKDPRDPGVEWSLPEVLTPGWLGDVTDPDFLYAEYRAEVDYLDAELAKLLDEPRIRDGVVAFTADHGENFGEHDVWFSHGGLYPSTLHVPLLMRWPGGPKRMRSQAAVRQMDVGRTLLNLAGLEETDYPGRDLRWGLEDASAGNPRFSLSSHGVEAAIESDGWLLNLSLADHKLMRSSLKRPMGRVELFHIEEDPKGTVDVLEANLPRAKRLRARLIEWLEAGPAEGFASDAHSSPQMEALLNELGYAQGAEVQAADWWRPEELDGDWATNPWNVMFQD